MKLPPEKKQELADYFKDREIYSPAEDPKQDVPVFSQEMPEGMACGGEVKGYQQGGEISLGDPMGFEDPEMFDIAQGGSSTVRGLPPAITPQAPALSPAQGSPFAPKASTAAAPSPMRALPPVQNQPMGARMSDNDMEMLRQALNPSKGQRFGKAAMAGLGGFADAIMSGVARAGSPGFQKGITDMDQQNKQNLIDALKTKYQGEQLQLGTRLEAERTKESERHNRAIEQLTGGAQAAAQKEKQVAREEQKKSEQLEAGEKLAKLSSPLNPFSAQAEAVRQQRARLQEISSPTVTSDEEYNALPVGAHYKGPDGKARIKK